MRIQTATLILALFAAALLMGAPPDEKKADEPIVMISEENSRAYTVEPGETLGEAMASAPLAQTTQEEEKGVCVKEGLADKIEGAVGCKCYEQTECNGTESHTCKRHCRKDLCDCCASST